MPKSQRLVWILLFISLLAGAITGWPIYFRLTYLWLFLLLGSWIMSKIALSGIGVHRTARALRSQVGQIFEERYEVRNRGRIPRIWIEVRDQSELPGSHGSHVLTSIGGYESRTYLARTRLSERGVFPLGPTTLAAGDLFGLFPVKKSFPSEEALLVYPLMVDVLSFPNPPGLLPGGDALRRRTPQITSNASGVREYEPGDPLNRIHWLSTARRNRLISKEFELDPLAEVWIFVDAASAVQASRPTPKIEFDPQDIWRKKFKFNLPPSTLEYAVTASASLARYYIQRGRSVGLVSADQNLRLLPSDRGGRQLGKILEALAVLREGTMPLQGLLEAQARYLPRGSTVVMVTPSASEVVYKVTDMLVRRGLRPVAVLIDGSTFGGMFSNQELSATLKALGIPQCVLREGDDLSAVLSTTISSFKWGIF